MKRKIALSALIFFALAAMAQQNSPAKPNTAEIDWTEDTTEIVTIQDIINIQQRQTKRNTTENHFVDVWGRRSFVNFAYNTAKLTPQESIPTGVPSLNGGLLPEMSSDWGFTLQYGRNYRLHKKPIANIMYFHVDYTGIDLGVNHFKAEGNGKNLYDSREKTKEDYFYRPWNLDKYEFNYAMTLGPSLTVAPFNLTNSRALHFLKFNVYYHIGYHLSLVFMDDDEDADINPGTSRTEKDDRQRMADNQKLEWGHGMTQSFGFNLSWKLIGIGYEHRTRSMKYKSMNTTDFGKEKFDFDVSDSRLYLQLRM